MTKLTVADIKAIQIIREEMIRAFTSRDGIEISLDDKLFALKFYLAYHFGLELGKHRHKVENLPSHELFEMPPLFTVLVRGKYGLYKVTAEIEPLYEARSDGQFIYYGMVYLISDMEIIVGSYGLTLSTLECAAFHYSLETPPLRVGNINVGFELVIEKEPTVFTLKNRYQHGDIVAKFCQESESQLEKYYRENFEWFDSNREIALSSGRSQARV